MVVVVAVDDDFRVRESIESLVESAGYAPQLFPTAEEFLTSGTLPVAACVITDVRMPHLTGVELHDQLLAQGHVLPTIFITAFPTPDLQAKLNAPGVVAILEKPIDPTVMVDYIEQVLGVA